MARILLHLQHPLFPAFEEADYKSMRTCSFPELANARCVIFLRTFGQLVLLCIILVSLIPPLAAATPNNCAQVKPLTRSSGSDSSANTLLEHQFESSASWSFCWRIDSQRGLEISNVHYGAPGEPPRQLLASAAIGQLLLKYDSDIFSAPLVSQSGLGNTKLSLLQQDCVNGQLRTNASGHSICTRVRDLNNLTRSRRSESVRRHALSIHSWSQIGTHTIEQRWQFSEDGELSPGIRLSGTISRYTNDARYGVPINDSGKLASSATLLSNWRLAFAIAGDAENDVVDEFNFPLSKGQEATRPLEITRLTKEQFRKVERTDFRGWRISDATLATGPTQTNPVAYYLDPQSSGLSFFNPEHRWSEADLAITRAKTCERLASDNQQAAQHIHEQLNQQTYLRPEQQLNQQSSQACADNLVGFVNDETLESQGKVIWFNLVRHILPRKEDYPAIGAVDASFKLIPFDWSAQSPFTAELR